MSPNLLEGEGWRVYEGADVSNWQERRALVFSNVRPIPRTKRLKCRFQPCVKELEGRVNPGVILPPAAGIHPGGPGGAYQVVAYGVGQSNNDNDAGKTNYVSRVLSFTARDYIDMELLVDNSQGHSEFWMEDEAVNFTAASIGAFTWELGFGIGANFGPVTVIPGEGLLLSPALTKVIPIV
jgi:hypothetical protein